MKRLNHISKKACLCLLLLIMVSGFVAMCGRNHGYPAQQIQSHASPRGTPAAFDFESRPGYALKWGFILGGISALIIVAFYIWNRALKRLVRERTSTLAESEERFRATFERAAVGIAHVLPEGRFVRINQTFCDIVGYTNEEMLDKTFQELTHPEDLEASIEQAAQLLSGHIAEYSMDKRYIRKDGTAVWVNVIVSLVQDNEGQPLWGVAAVKDISARKQAEEERHAAYEKLRNIFQTSPAAITITNLSTAEVLDVNQAFEREFGFSREEIIGRSVLDIHLWKNPEDRRLLIPPYRKQGYLHAPELELRRKSGETAVVDAHFSLMRTGDEEISIAAFNDITERKYAEEALKESEAKYRTLVNHAQDGIVIVQDERIRFANPSMTAMLEYTVEELLATPLSAYIAAEELPRMEEPCRRPMGRDIAGRVYELIMCSKGGRHLTVEFHSGSTIYQGKPADLIIVRDITARKESERILQEYQRRLRELVSQLTIAEELERQRIAADLHDHISHSLVLARLQLHELTKTKSRLETKTLIHDVSNLILKALQDTKNLIFELSPPNLKSMGLSKALVEFMDEHIGQRYGIATEIVDTSSGDLALDSNVSSILFRNVRELSGNVIQHAKARKVKVSLANTSEEVVVTVADDGIGFDPEAISRHVGPKGGFGLFSIRERLSDLGGSLDIESAPGKGCTAVMRVPIGKRQETGGEVPGVDRRQGTVLSPRPGCGLLTRDSGAGNAKDNPAR